MTPDSPLNDEEQEDLVAYLDGELDEDAAHALETRLSLDPTARSEADSLKRTWDLLDYLPRPEPSRDFTERTLTRLNAKPTRALLERHRRLRRWLLRCGWAAAILLAGSGGYAVTMWSLPSPQTDQELIQDLGLIENLRFYDQTESVEFLRQLDDPALFGDPDS